MEVKKVMIEKKTTLQCLKIPGWKNIKVENERQISLLEYPNEKQHRNRLNLFMQEQN